MSNRNEPINNAAISVITHCASKLQSSMKEILRRGITSQELDNILVTLPEGDKRKGMFSSREFKIAVLIKTLYEQGRMSTIDNILSCDDFDLKKAIGDRSSAKTFKVSDADSESGDVKEFIARNHSKFPPPLPSTINSKELKDQLHGVSRSGLSSMRLVFLGTSVLTSLITSILWEWFPSYGQDGLTKLTQYLIKNSQLTKWCRVCNLTMFLPDEDTITHLDSQVLIDTFKAYVGALSIESKGEYSNIIQWLKILCIPALKTFIDSNENMESLDDSQAVTYAARPAFQQRSTPEAQSLVGAPMPPLVESQQLHLNGAPVIITDNSAVRSNIMGELYAMIGTSADRPRYEITPKQGPYGVNYFYCVLSIDNVFLGSGSASNSKLAKRLAAQDALDNNYDLVLKYQIPTKKKRSYAIIPQPVYNANNDSQFGTGYRLNEQDPYKRRRTEEGF
ncbi:hypothetical protein DASC09_053090 [Saccharomycopsis crataegensis]|uniref:DRBM domain-containing protein n=1 Tax=Saccharomycopsis crataegensis TaxID=43959 RepID=A0AAV5QT96_9ASCO|nr:hypothetical protein DASC09_053090 [Saccharomycopsis crataegensis]